MVDATTTNSIVQQTAPDRWQVSSGSVSFHGTAEQMAVRLAFMMEDVSRLRSLTTPRPISEAPKDETVVLCPGVKCGWIPAMCIQGKWYRFKDGKIKAIRPKCFLPMPPSVE